MLDRLETERRESGYRALVAEEAERRRVAAELHDEIGQRLTALVLQIDRLSRAAPPELGDEFAGTLAATKETLEGVRGLARRLRPEVLDELGLVPALRNLCDRIEEGPGSSSGASLEPELPSLSPDAELVIYRVAQEALTNVVRHAGRGGGARRAGGRTTARSSWWSTTTASAFGEQPPRIPPAASGGCANVPC